MRGLLLPYTEEERPLYACMYRLSGIDSQCIRVAVVVQLNTHMYTCKVLWFVKLFIAFEYDLIEKTMNVIRINWNYPLPAHDIVSNTVHVYLMVFRSAPVVCYRD